MLPHVRKWVEGLLSPSGSFCAFLAEHRGVLSSGDAEEVFLGVSLDHGSSAWGSFLPHPSLHQHRTANH